MKETLAGLFAFVGAVLIVVGCYMLHPAVGLMASGLVFLSLSKAIVG